ncbi:MAG TPA: HEAT repeat domain-containing protein [Aggregatilineales bacterium]|nr:HEAT repeat domain-containing protein [Aggregatilineales bacterium]
MKSKRRVSADDALLDDLKAWDDWRASNPQFPERESLRDYFAGQGIRTYNQMYAAGLSDSADTDLLAHIGDALWFLDRKGDRRRMRPIILRLVRTVEGIPRSLAINQLGFYEGRKTRELLMQIAEDKTEAPLTRHDAVYSLASHAHIVPEVQECFIRLVKDTTDSVRVRGRALECMPEYPGIVDLCRTMLTDPSPDIRFWAAYCLTQTYHQDLTPVWKDLDRAVAYDHALPVGFGWHIDREALLPLETFYFQAHLPPFDSDYDGGRTPDFRLISPAAEYDSFINQHRKWQEDWTYTTDESVLPITLRIEPDWLRERIHEQWPDAKFNTRQPRPSAYLLDWLIEIDGELLSGALHRDQYAVVITSTPHRGSEQALFAFAAWYRGIIDATVPLYLYQWADEATLLEPGDTATALAEREYAREDARRTWVGTPF